MNEEKGDSSQEMEEFETVQLEQLSLPPVTSESGGPEDEHVAEDEGHMQNDDEEEQEEEVDEVEDQDENRGHQQQQHMHVLVHDGSSAVVAVGADVVNAGDPAGTAEATLETDEAQSTLQTAAAGPQGLVSGASEAGGDTYLLYRCGECQRAYRTRDGLRSHMRKAHQTAAAAAAAASQKASPDQACLEPNCDAVFHSKADLCAHLESVHQLQLDQLSMLFMTVPRFYAWMEEYQEATGTRFVRTCGSKQFPRTGTRMQFMCHRSGKCRGKSTPLRLRKERAHGPLKVGVQCVLHLRVLERPYGHVEIEGCVSHYGHELDEQFMSLLPSHRCRVARFIQLGQPAYRVADLLKHMAHPASPLARLSSADVRNIEQCFGRQFTDNVANCLFAAVGAVLESAPSMVLVHKPIGAEVDGLDPAEFYAVVLTPNQLELFERYATRIAAVCVDTVTQFSFSIVTLNCYVRSTAAGGECGEVSGGGVGGGGDDSREHGGHGHQANPNNNGTATHGSGADGEAANNDEGNEDDDDGPLVFPLAWFITSSLEPQLYIPTFYYAVVGQTGKFNCDLFFSDDHDEYFVHFLHTFGRDRVPKRHVNLWQLKHTLELALVQHADELSKALAVYPLLDDLFRMPVSVKEFGRHLAGVQDVLVSENVAQPFVELFESQFASRSLLWAPCYVDEECASIYGEFEREHTTMALFLDHMLMNRWGGKIVEGLVSYSSPHNVNYRLAVVQLNTEDQESSQASAAAAAATATDVISQAPSKEFVLKSNGGDFTVIPTGRICQPGCESRCTCCSLCVHEYTCSCWWEQESFICDHIHAIAAFLRRKGFQSEEEAAEQPPTSAISSPLSCRLPQHLNKLELISGEVARLKEALLRPETDESLKTYMNRLRSMQNLVSSLLTGAELTSCHSADGVTNQTVMEHNDESSAADQLQHDKDGHHYEHHHYQQQQQQQQQQQLEPQSEVDSRTTESVESDVTMTHNPQMVTVAPHSKLHVIVPRNVVVDTVPPTQAEQWSTNVRLHQEALPPPSSADVVRVVLSNTAPTSATLLLSCGERAKLIAMGKRVSERTRIVKAIRTTRNNSSGVFGVRK